MVAVLVALLGMSEVRAEEAAEPAASDEALSFSLEGYYRTRGHLFQGLFADQERPAGYVGHRLRLRPRASYADLASLHVQVDALDDVIWGDNASLAPTAVFAGNPSETARDGGSAPGFRVSRAWLEATLPVGVVRVGRQPSHWGLGILANDGLGFPDTFGEYGEGSTADRVLFATRPLAVLDAIRGRDDAGIPLIAAVGMDMLVQEPLHRYHGFRCQPGLVKGEDDGYDPRCDRNGDGVTDREHDLVSERAPEDRGQDWWSDPSDTVRQSLFVLAYQGEQVPYLGSTGDLTLGTYVVHRTQEVTESDVLIADVYLDAHWRSLIVQLEALHIRGSTRAITLPGAYDPSGDGDPLFKEAHIWGYVGRLGYENPVLTAVLEHGYASGDDDVTNVRFTGRALHPDHQVGLLLYRQVMARLTAHAWGEAGQGLWSQGGVVNSRYFFPHLRVRPFDRDDLELIAAFLVAWPDRPDGAIIRCAPGDRVSCAQTPATSPMLGWEADLGVRVRWQEHMLWTLEAAYAQTTDRLALEPAGLNPEGRFFTLQSRIAYVF